MKLSVSIKYSMHDLSCYVINYGASSFDMGKLSVCDKVVGP